MGKNLKINSPKWWENEFKYNWEKGINGNIQTKLFSEIVYSLINPIIKSDIKKLKYDFIDFGCAHGQGLMYLLKPLRQYNFNEIIGIDISKIAVKKAKKLYPEFLFYNNLNQIKNIDLIYTSNTLEHFKNPKSVLDKLLNKSKNYVIVLVPYKQEPTDIHFYKFTKKSFKNFIWDRPKWIIIQLTEIGKIDKLYSPTKQILCIYKKIF